MKPSKTLGTITLATITTLALAATMTTTITTTSQAATLPNILPEATEAAPLTADSTSGELTFGNGILKTTSRKSKGTLTGNALKLGHFDILLEETEMAAGAECTGLNDSTTGSILLLGTYHVRHYLSPAGTLRTVLILLSRPVHFWCEVLVLWEGCIGGELSPEATLTKILVATFVKSGERDKITTVLKEELNGEESCLLLATENGPPKKIASLVTTQTFTEFKQGGSTVEVLAMPL